MAVTKWSIQAQKKGPSAPAARRGQHLARATVPAVAKESSRVV
jgi:hypothetical protein